MNINNKLLQSLVCAVFFAWSVSAFAQGVESSGGMGTASGKPDAVLAAAIQMQDEKQLAVFAAKWKLGTDPEAKLYAGIALHNLARINPGRWAKESAEILASYRGTKFQALAMAYQGSTLTLVASFYSVSGNLAGATAKLAEGFTLMDKAVKADGADATIRTMRAENGLEISETTPFSRTKEVGEDLKALSASVESMGPEAKSNYWLMSGRLCLLQKNVKAAMDFLYKAVSSAPDSPSARKAKILLARMED